MSVQAQKDADETISGSGYQGSEKKGVTVRLLNRGHLEEVDQSYYKKITIHSEKVG